VHNTTTNPQGEEVGLLEVFCGALPRTGWPRGLSHRIAGGSITPLYHRAFKPVTSNLSFRFMEKYHRWSEIEGLITSIDRKIDIKPTLALDAGYGVYSTRTLS